MASGPVVLTGCRAGDAESQARKARLQERLDQLAVALDEMEHEHALQQKRLSAARKELAELCEQILPGVPRAQTTTSTITGTTRARTGSPASADKDPARSAATDRFLRNFAILCFTAFLIVAGAKIWRKRHQGPDGGPAESRRGPAATVFHPRPADEASGTAEEVSIESVPDDSARDTGASVTVAPEPTGAAEPEKPVTTAEAPASEEPQPPAEPAAPAEPAEPARPEAAAPETVSGPPAPESLQAETATEDHVPLEVQPQEPAQPEPASASEEPATPSAAETEPAPEAAAVPEPEAAPETAPEAKTETESEPAPGNDLPPADTTSPPSAAGAQAPPSPRTASAPPPSRSSSHKKGKRRHR